jgi:hypothetical protein
MASNAPLKPEMRQKCAAWPEGKPPALVFEPTKPTKSPTGNCLGFLAALELEGFDMPEFGGNIFTQAQRKLHWCNANWISK